MTMPSDAINADDQGGVDDRARDHDGVDTDHEAYVDDANVPHPGDDNETR